MNAAEPTAREEDASGASSVDADNPWLGLASFTEQTRGYFYGREQEIAELERRVHRKLLTVLFGKSGLGKTSILQAGLVPRLRERGYFPVYLRIDYGHDSPEPAEQIKLAIGKASASGQWTQVGVAVPGESIWEFLHHRDDVLKDASGATLTPLLIFDQFEELFTLAQSDESGRTRAARFVEELADLVENRPPKALEAKLDTDDSAAERFDFARSDYRVVIALREDYLAPLESLKKLMPSLSQNRLRLAPMTGDQALEAVLRPGRRLVSQEVAEAIVRFVAGGAELSNAEVEPSLLSLICRELNEQRIAQGRAEISQDLLAGSHETILSNFYERSLADQPVAVRRIIEDELLTESGYRENLAEESLLRRFQAAGAAPDALAKLVNRRLLRIEERLDVRRVELTHDVLTGVVKASRDQRREREAREATERMLAEQAAREHSARRALRRVRAVAAGCTLLAALAVLAAAVAFSNVRRARRAEQVAQQTRAVSEQARGQAEGLLGFLTDDFVRELETFGRYQTIAELSQREIDYFRALPATLKDPQTVRSGALALVNHANAITDLGDLDTSGRDGSEAVALLEGLRRGGDRSEPTTVALANAYVAQFSTFVGQTNISEANTVGTRAIELLRPIVGRADARAGARRVYVEALGARGFLEAYLLRPRNNEQAVRDSREAQRVALQLGAHRGDVTLDTDYAYAGIGLVEALDNLSRNEDARRAGADALAVADRVLSQRPQYGRALFAKQFIEEGLASLASNELDPAEAVRVAMQGVQTSLALVQIEPQNRIYVNNLAILEESLGGWLWGTGRLRESVAALKKSMDAYGQAAAGVARAIDLYEVSNDMEGTAVSQAQLGDPAGAEATVAAADALISAGKQGEHGLGVGTSMSFVSLSAYEARGFVRATLAYEGDDFGAVRRDEQDWVAHVRAVRHQPSASDPSCDFSDLAGHADYQLGDFAAAAQAERTAVATCRAGAAAGSVDAQRDVAQMAIWLSMALAREGKQAEAVQTIGPVVTMYRMLAAKNRGDAWLPLEQAGALYAQSLSDPRQRAALLRQAVALMDHLTPAIAALHDTRQWRVRIEAAQRRSDP